MNLLTLLFQVGLAGVDLSTPLGRDEQLPSQAHREVPTVSLLDAKSDPNELKKRGKHKHKRDKSANRADDKPSDLLLGLEWSEAAAPPSDNNLLDFALDASVVDVRKGTTASSKKNKFWLLLHSDAQVRVLYSASLSERTGFLHFKTSNLSREGSAVSAMIQFAPSEGCAEMVGRSVQLAEKLAPEGEQSVKSNDVQLLRGVTVDSGPADLSCSLQLSTEALLGTESRQIQATVTFHPCLSFSPSRVSEQEFEALLSKSSGQWGSSSTQLACRNRAQAKGIKSIAAFLRAHVVETEPSSRAASMCAATDAGNTVCVLAKISDSSSISVSIKCLCASKRQSDRLAADVATWLQCLCL